MHFEQCFLGKFIGKLVVATKTVQVKSKSRLVAMDEQPERVIVAFGDQRHQPLVLFVVGEHGLFLGHRFVITPGKG
jgi:hypothetical protein